MDSLQSADECLKTLEELQREHILVVRTMLGISEHLPKLKQIVKGYVRANYKQAFDETKKNAGQETLEQWAGSKIGKDYDDYVYYDERFEELRKISDAYLGNISSVQSRLSFFRNL